MYERFSWLVLSLLMTNSDFFINLTNCSNNLASETPEILAKEGSTIRELAFK